MYCNKSQTIFIKLQVPQICAYKIKYNYIKLNKYFFL